MWFWWSIFQCDWDWGIGKLLLFWVNIEIALKFIFDEIVISPEYSYSMFLNLFIFDLILNVF